MEKKRNIDFVVSHFKEGRFAVNPALRRVKGMVTTSWWKRSRLAAASVALVVLGAAAAVILIERHPENRVEPKEMVSPAPVPALVDVKVIDFEEAPLPVVVSRIRDVYGVSVTGLPDNAESYTLSLHYEGTASDLVATINEILDTEMRIEE